MVAPKEKEKEETELPKITITKPPQAKEEEIGRLKVIPKPVPKVPKETAEKAMTEAERNATKVAREFTEFFIKQLEKTPEGRNFLSNLRKNSEIGYLLFS
jgi:hypothetical protein